MLKKDIYNLFGTNISIFKVKMDSMETVERASTVSDAIGINVVCSDIYKSNGLDKQIILLSLNAIYSFVLLTYCFFTSSIKSVLILKQQIALPLMPKFAKLREQSTVYSNNNWRFANVSD
jgi:hypothetical protein